MPLGLRRTKAAKIAACSASRPPPPSYSPAGEAGELEQNAWGDRPWGPLAAHQDTFLLPVTAPLLVAWRHVLPSTEQCSGTQHLSNAGLRPCHWFVRPPDAQGVVGSPSPATAFVRTGPPRGINDACEAVVPKADQYQLRNPPDRCDTAIQWPHSCGDQIVLIGIN